MKIRKLIHILILAAMLLSGCASATTEAPQVAVTEEVVATEVSEVVVEPTATALPEAKPEGSEQKLILATTSSTQDSGLLDVILPVFEQETGIKVDVIAVGTGQALQLGIDGNADVLLVHARAKEDEFMANGHGVRREDVMYNDFVILGPEADPAGIKGMTSAVDAFKKLAETQSVFISRGDDSGTHTKELSIWKKAEIEPAGDWYISSGQTMGEVLTMTNEQQAYTLSDRATYLARTLEGLNLVVLVEGDSTLFNPYGVITVNPAKSEKIQNDLANQFMDWIISLPTQELIASYGMEEFGQSLFIPDSTAWREAHPAEPTEEPAPVVEVALKVTGKVAQEMGWSEAEVLAMETITVESTNKDGAVKSYTGVSLNALLALAGVSADATTIVFVADDGYTAEVSLAEVQACTNCILSFRSQGGFSSVLPGFSSGLQVKGVVEIKVK